MGIRGKFQGGSFDACNGFSFKIRDILALLQKRLPQEGMARPVGGRNLADL